MLRGIDSVIPPRLLYVLAAMGHGDAVAVVDANFPAASHTRRLITVGGVDSTVLLRAIAPLFPVDDFIADPLVTMEVVGDAAAVPEAVAEYGEILAPLATKAVPRGEFYHRAREAFAVVQTGDRRLYANIILVKGVIRA